jgi:hypothetical protein
MRTHQKADGESAQDHLGIFLVDVQHPPLVFPLICAARCVIVLTPSAPVRALGALSHFLSSSHPHAVTTHTPLPGARRRRMSDEVPVLIDARPCQWRPRHSDPTPTMRIPRAEHFATCVPFTACHLRYPEAI